MLLCALQQLNNLMVMITGTADFASIDLTMAVVIINTRGSQAIARNHSKPHLEISKCKLHSQVK